MNKHIHTLTLITTFVFLQGCTQNTSKSGQNNTEPVTQSKSDKIDPYADTDVANRRTENSVIRITPDQINVLAGNVGDRSAGLKNVFKNYMSLWVAADSTKTHSVQWEIDVKQPGVYSVTAVVAGQGSSIVVSCGEDMLEATISEKEWSRLSVGNVNLDLGKKVIKVKIEAADGFKLSNLELTTPETKSRLLEKFLAQRKQPDWFRDAGYGLMFQWTNRATPPEGPIKQWDQKVNDFDIEAFVNMVESTGASYVVWSATWGNQYISAPIKSLDEIISGRTTKRDLLGEMADLLHERGIKLIFYYHYGYECYHSRDMPWLEAVGGLKPDKTQLYDNMMSIISEVGERYGDKLHGWWFDGGARYYNCHFDGSSTQEGILSAPFERITVSARTGNPDRIVAYNSWIKPRITEFQDYYGGEGVKSFSNVENGTIISGRQEGLQAHGCFTLEKRWGHIDMNTPITKPKYSLEQLVGFVQKAQKSRYPLSVNLEMYEDGSVSPASLKLLQELKNVIGK